MYLSKKLKNGLQLCVGVALLTANVSFAALIFPSSLLTKQGSATAQHLEVLAVKDQQGSSDNPKSYVEFQADQTGYSGTFKFNLPAAPDSTVQTLTFQANYRGPEKSLQKWEFQLLNVKTGKWAVIADNGGVADGLWSDVVATVTDPAQFVNSQNQIRLRYVGRNGGSKSQLDFLAVNVKTSAPAQTTPPPTSGSGTPSPVTAGGSYWQPTPGLKWQIQYAGTLDTSLAVDVYNLDLFDTSASVISDLKSKGKHVVCYFSAGSYENWRPDTGSFPASVLGRDLDGWAGEKWLDVRNLDVLIPIMRARMELAAQK